MLLANTHIKTASTSAVLTCIPRYPDSLSIDTRLAPGSTALIGRFLVKYLFLKRRQYQMESGEGRTSVVSRLAMRPRRSMSRGPEGYENMRKEFPLDEDSALVVRIASGDLSAFEEMVRKYQAAVYRLAFRATYNHEDARDLTQEVFLDAFRSIRGFRRDSKLGTWLYRIATNKTIDWWRRQRRQGARVISFTCLEEISCQDNPEGHSGEFDPPDDDIGPEETVINRERAELLWREVAALPENYRIVIILYHYEGLSYREIGEILKLPLRTVETRLYRAKKILQSRLVGGGKF